MAIGSGIFPAMDGMSVIASGSETVTVTITSFFASEVGIVSDDAVLEDASEVET